MPNSHHVKKSINRKEDIEVSDIFEISDGYSSYFIVTRVSRSDDEIVLEGVERDGIYDVGNSEMREYTASDVIENMSDRWSYAGVFAHDGEDINRNEIDLEEIIKQEALEKYRDN